MAAPPERAWEILTDTMVWPEWGPSVRAVRHPSRFIGPDSRGHIQTPLGLWLPFRVTEFDEGQSWAWKVAGIPATGHRVEALGPGRCRVAFEVPLLALPYLTVCSRALKHIAALAERH